MRVEIRRVKPNEGEMLMRIRLMSLLDAPYAFATSYLDDAQLPAEAWSERASRAASGDEEAVYVADAPVGWVGLVGAYTPRASERHLYGMWVDPGYRGQGLGEALLHTVEDWARLAGATTLSLWVAETNEPAVALYRRCGYELDGGSQPMPNDPTVIEQSMTRRLT